MKIVVKTINKSPNVIVIDYTFVNIKNNVAIAKKANIIPILFALNLII